MEGVGVAGDVGAGRDAVAAYLLSSFCRAWPALRSLTMAASGEAGSDAPASLVKRPCSMGGGGGLHTRKRVGGLGIREQEEKEQYSPFTVDTVDTVDSGR